MQHFLKPEARVAWAEIIPAELLEKFDLTALEGAITLLHASFAQGTPGAASTCAQKEERVSKCLWRGIEASMLKEPRI